MLENERQELLNEIISAVELGELTQDAADVFKKIINKVTANKIEKNAAIAPETVAKEQKTLSAHQPKLGLFGDSTQIYSARAVPSNLSREARMIFQRIEREKRIMSHILNNDPIGQARRHSSIGNNFLELALVTDDESYNNNALEAFNTALALDPDDLYCLGKRAELHVKMGNYELAETHLHILKSSPKPKIAINAIALKMDIDSLERSLANRNEQQATSSL
jgi:tetratricopeptide (TPR) repeat protein